MLYIGVDIGGMSVKAGLVNENGKITVKSSAVTRADAPAEEIVADIAALVEKVAELGGVKVGETGGVGVGSPGSVDDAAGVIRYSCNINFVRTPFVALMRSRLSIDNVKISNDANCAALGETMFGAGRGAKNSVTVTLGTGVGTGIVVDGRLLTGNKSAGAEGGHVIIKAGGVKCGYGKRGCFEAYASATALMRQTAEAAARHPESLLAKMAAESGIDGKTAFIAAKQGDKTAKRVISNYIRYVGTGLVGFANVFYPEVFIIGGGISKEGDALIAPLRRFIKKNAYGAEFNPPIDVVAATLGNDAGIIGAAALAMAD